MHLSSRLNRLRAYAAGILAAHPTLAAAATDSAPERIEAPWLFLQFAWERGESFGWQRIGNCLLIATALSLLLFWPFARMIAGRKRVLMRTALFAGSVIALSAAFLALAGFIVPGESMALLAALGIAYVAILFTQARHIFAASRAAAAGVVGSYFVVAAVALYATELLTGPMPWTDFLSKPREEQRRTFAEWGIAKKALATVAPAPVTPAPGPEASPAASAASNAAATPADAPGTTLAQDSTATPRPPIAAPDLHALYVQLQKTRAELDTSDPVAVARFNQQTAAYNQEKAIAAALSIRRPLSAQTEPAESAKPEKAGQNSPAAKPARK